MKGKIIALDFGLKRTGIAVTDELQIIASPLETLNSVDLEPYLQKFVQTNVVAAIVIGEPKNMDGSPTDVTRNVYLLKEALQKRFPKIQICLHDERFTSKMASQTISVAGLKKGQRKEKALIDKVSAAILLQSFLNFESTRSGRDPREN
jgi:putative Holliday junction resolvase